MAHRGAVYKRKQHQKKQATSQQTTPPRLEQSASSSSSDSMADSSSGGINFFNRLTPSFFWICMWTVAHFSHTVSAVLPSTSAVAGSIGDGASSSSNMANGVLSGIAFACFAAWAAITYSSSSSVFRRNRGHLSSYADANPHEGNKSSRFAPKTATGEHQYEQLHPRARGSTAQYDFASTNPTTTATSTTTTTATTPTGESGIHSSSIPFPLYTSAQFDRAVHVPWPTLSEALEDGNIDDDEQDKAPGWGDFASASAGIDWECVRKASQEARRQRTLTANLNSFSSDKGL